MALQAGVGRVDISPRRPMFLVGYPHVPRTSTGVHDPLYATALCLRDEAGGAAVCLVAVDILFVDRDTARQCREAITAATGIAADHVLISATHTHSGPVTVESLVLRNDPVVPPADPAYMETFSASIVRAAREAWERAVPARLALTTAHAEGVGGNRLRPDGPADPEVGVAYGVRAADRSPLALSLVYSMHPTVLHEDTTLVSADFPGYARRYLEHGFPGASVLYHTGTEGNQSPRYFVKGQTFAEAQRLGERLGQAVERALAALPAAAFTDRPPLGAARVWVDLPVRSFPSPAQAEARLGAAVEAYERLKRERAPHGVVRTAECTVFGAEEVVTLARAQARGEIPAWAARCLPAEVQALRIGDSVWVGLPGEVFVEYGLEIKRRAAPWRTFVIGLANGELQGYVVTPEADAAGTYEARCSLLAPAAGRILVDQALALVRALG
jgi:hypothetical protein